MQEEVTHFFFGPLGAFDRRIQEVTEHIFGIWIKIMFCLDMPFSNSLPIKHSYNRTQQYIL